MRNLTMICTILVLSLNFVGSTSALGGSEELNVANQNIGDLTDQWTSYWGSQYKFIDVAGLNSSLELVLSSCEHSAAVIALLGDGKPMRRNVSIGQPFIQVANDPHVNAQSPHTLSAPDPHPASPPDIEQVLGFSALNKGASALEAVLGRPLHAFRLTFMPFPVSSRICKKPYAVWDVSSGDVYIDQILVSSMGDAFQQVERTMAPFADSLVVQLKKFAPQANQSDLQASLWSQLVTGVLPGALLIAVGSQVPLWFCIACPVVLGLLAPFIFNAGFGAAAEAICTHYKLLADECNDLWYGAFAAAMILSFAAAIPIVYICQIPKCGRTQF